METYRGLTGRAALCFCGAVAVCILGCGTGEKASIPPRPTAAETAQMDFRREVALTHFIAGSVYEVKGEYAQAALEYQEALRADTNHAMYFALAKCYSALNKPALALDAAREAVR
ncbi:MAG TPA: hypothetical protein VK569_07915, partial [Bacteroidota bacterium]|nr:hypothetical protein [Bacteroidota bacterium]